MKKLIFIFPFILGIIFSSCKDDAEYLSVLIEKDIIEFKYNGNLYTTSYKLFSDSSVIYEKKDVGELFEKIVKLPELCLVEKKDSVIEFYDSYDVYNELSKRNVRKSNRRVAYPTDARIRLYENFYSVFQNKYFEGLSTLRQNNVITKFELPNLQNLKTWNQNGYWGYCNFDNILSAFEMTGYTALPNSYCDVEFIFYELENYGGRSRVIQDDLAGRPSNRYVNDFDNYTMIKGSLFTKKVNWNDQISSLKFSIMSPVR